MAATFDFKTFKTQALRAQLLNSWHACTYISTGTILLLYLEYKHLELSAYVL